MVNLRSRSKARDEAPDLSDAALRKLSRSELQKLAMAHKVKANMKSELIIRQLSGLQIPKKTRPAEDDPEEGPSRKRFKGEATLETTSNLPEDQAATPLDAKPSRNPSVKTSAEAGPSTPRSVPPAQKVPTILSYDEDLFSRTESEMTEEEQLDFATPISSRDETPPPANVNDLKRCVTIMQEISTQDVVLLKGVTAVRQTAAKLFKKARDIRDLVKAERGRRERMEAYFRYWQETEPSWDRQWLYGEQRVQDHEDLDNSQRAQRPHLRATPVPGQKRMLSPEELKRKREAIILKQEAEQRQLAAIRRREMRGENSSEGGSVEAADDCSLHGPDLPPTDH